MNNFIGDDNLSDCRFRDYTRYNCINYLHCCLGRVTECQYYDPPTLIPPPILKLMWVGKDEEIMVRLENEASMNKQEFWEEQCDRLLDALWTGWEQFYPGHKRPDNVPEDRTKMEIV